jgi:hypothetical protein
MPPRTFLTIALVCAVPVCASRPLVATQSASPRGYDLPGWLDRYEQGAHDAVLAEVMVAPDIKTLGKQLAELAARWVAAKGPAAIDRRRLIAATFALEAIRPAMERVVPVMGSPVAAPILEWACQLLRSTPTPLPAERWWHLAAAALIERSFNEYLLTGHLVPGARSNPYAPVGNHLQHSVARFPDEPRFKLAALVSREAHITGGAWSWLSRPLTASSRPGDAARMAQQSPGWIAVTEDRDAPARRRLITEYTALAAIEAIRAESRLRGGVLEFRLGNHEAALDHLRQVEPNTREPALVYLSRFFRAKALERAGRPADAETEYRSALRAVPLADSAATALAAALFLRGERSEAGELIEAMFTARPTPADPWRDYWCGDCRLWSRYIERLREELR